MQTNRSIWPGLSLTVLCLAAAPAGADYTPLYSNITTFTGQGYAAGTGTATVGGQLNTLLIADDITAGAGLGGLGVYQITFTVANFNSTAVTAGTDLRIYAGNGTGSGPGTLLAAINFNPISFGAGSVGAFTFTSTTPIFTMPSTLFWAGLSFNNFGGSTSATAAQLNNLGMGIFDPPTIGSSQDAFFQSSAATSGDAGNVAGSFQFFGGNPHANFGFTFSTITAVPEPPSVAMAGVALLALGAFGFRFRARLAA